METERYDVNAKAPEGSSNAQIREMLQSLLLDRFQMTLHREQKDATVYFLTVGKNGHKIKESAPDPNSPQPKAPDGAPMIPQRPTGPPAADKDGYPILTRTGWVSTSAPDGLIKLTASRQSIADLIRMLTFQVGRDIVDQTGLTGKYDYRLEFGGNGRMVAGMPPMPFPRPGIPGPAPAPAGEPSDPSGPTIFKALQDQLGLKLEAGKAPREMIVVDKALKVPIEN